MRSTTGIRTLLQSSWVGLLTGHVHRHFLNLGAVELFDLAHHAHVISRDKVNGDALASEAATAANAVDVVLAVGGQVVVDDERDLLDVDATGEQVGSDEHARGTRAELLHDDVALGLVHVAVHGRHGEVARRQLVRQPVDLPARVAEDDGLGDGDGLVEVREGVELPVLLLDGDVELLDTFEGKLILLDEDAHRVAHELGRDLEYVLGHSGREKNNLGGLRKQLEDIVDLLGETALEHELAEPGKEHGFDTHRKHFISLVKHKHLHRIGLKEAARYHVLNTAGGTNNHLRAIL